MKDFKTDGTCPNPECSSTTFHAVKPYGLPDNNSEIYDCIMVTCVDCGCAVGFIPKDTPKIE